METAKVKKRKPKKEGTVLTHKYKIYGKKRDFLLLDKMARSCNFVWNYCVQAGEHVNKNFRIPTYYYALNEKNERVRKKYDAEAKTVDFPFYNPYVNTYTPGDTQVLQLPKGFISDYDLQKLAAGAGSLLGLPSNTISAICTEYAKSVKTKISLITKGTIKSSGRFFIKFRGKKSRQWIPAKGQSLRFDHERNTLTFNGRAFKINLDRPLDGDICDGKFVKEPDGWYISLSLRQMGSRLAPRVPEVVIGVDLGLKTFATLSNGQKFDLDSEPRVRAWGREGTYTELVALFQSKRDRLLKKRGNAKPSKREIILTKKIRQLEKSASRWRSNQHYNIAHKILDQGSIIVVGDLSGKFIQAKSGKKGKSQSHGFFKERIKWIAQKRKQTVLLLNESNTTVTCSSCQEKTGPSGTEGLAIREWACKCGAVHDRDVNAAKNIAALYTPQGSASELKSADEAS